LSGEIPEFLQSVGKEMLSRQEGVRRDFSHNRLVGSLSSPPADSYTSNSSGAGFVVSDETVVAMDVNRLSGRIPRNSFIKRMSNIAILAGNLFACESHDDLPRNDPHYHFYTCGSDSLDYPLLLWVVFFGSVVVLASGVAMIAFFSSWKMQSGGVLLDDTVLARDIDRNGKKISPAFGANVIQYLLDAHSVAGKALRLWYSAIGQLDPVANMELVKFKETLQFVRYIAICITSLIVSAFLAFYCLGKAQWGWYTHMDQYRWLYSAAYLSGNWAALVMVSLLLTVLVLSTFMVQRFSDRSAVADERRVAARSLSVVSRSKHIAREPHKDIKNAASVVACFFINSSVVLCVQGTFVYVTTWHNVSPPVVVGLQLLLACFAIVWDNVVVLKVLIARFPRYLTAMGRSQLQNMIFLFNGVVAPVIVVGLTDPNCFSELITNSGEISTTSSIEYCVRISSYGCAELLTLVSPLIEVKLCYHFV
jgi:hypothetical protein